MSEPDLCGVVLAAGAGTRLVPLTRLRPKPLCTVGGAALVVLLDHLDALTPATAWACVAAIFVTRMVAVALDLNVPRPSPPPTTSAAPPG